MAHYPQPNEKTERQWNLAGYAVKKSQQFKGNERWTGHRYAYYYSDKQVKADPDITEKVKAEERKWRNEAQREKRAEARRLREWKKKKDELYKSLCDEAPVLWSNFLKSRSRILVFDTETTGLNSNFGYILSLSWQILDGELRTLDEQSRYFANPIPEKFCMDAIKVNGLTNERLTHLGTTDKKQALLDFMDAVKKSDLIVAHNYLFDNAFVSQECERNRVKGLAKRKPYFDTMKDMTVYCELLGYYDEYKWPKLSELAAILDVDTSDINWHQSSSDVEVTVRCLRKIAEKKLIENGDVTPLTFDIDKYEEYQSMCEDDDDY